MEITLGYENKIRLKSLDGKLFVFIGEEEAMVTDIKEFVHAIGFVIESQEEV